MAPVSPTPSINQSAYSGTLNNNTAPATPSVVTIGPTGGRTEQEMLMMKISQFVMMGIGFLAIWGGIFGVAFDENATNQNFLILFVGGLISFAISIGLIEMQSKKNDRHLHDIQNYFLGIAFFFSTVGVLWGTRYLMGVATGTLELTWFGDPATYTEVDWSPNANGIYAQLVACVLMTFGHYMILQRYTGDTGFGWGVATYAPMAILIAGVGPWIRWSGNTVSYELGISIILISIISMELALRSNKALNFGIVAFVSGLTPILYEVYNDVDIDGQGGAVSLLVFIIALQGYYASRNDLRKEVMERASLFLVGQVVVAILLTRNADFNLILGPLRQADIIGPAADFFTIPTALWCAVLFAYFPAVLKQRVPWMPIGLAVSLCALPLGPASALPWVLSIIMIPYMVFVSKVARDWAINSTVLAFGVSYLITDLVGITEGLSAKETYGGSLLHIILPIFIIALSELGRRRNRIQPSVSLALLASVLFSRAILEPEWFMPWLFILYMFYLIISMSMTSDEDNLSDRKGLTLASGFTSIAVLILGLLGHLEMPPGDMFDKLQIDGFQPQFLIVGLGMWVISRRIAHLEFDFGSIYKWAEGGSDSSPIYDSETGSWVLEGPSSDDSDDLNQIIEGMWTPLTRFSLIGSLVALSMSLFFLEANAFVDRPQWIFIIAIPVGILVYDIVSMPTIHSSTRAAGVGLLIALAFPIVTQLNMVVDDTFRAALILDAILVAAPLIVNSIITRRGVDEEGLNFSADVVSYLLLLVLASMDSSGGLLLLPIALLVMYRSVQFKQYAVAVTTPLLFIVVGDGWLTNPGLMNELLTRLPEALTTSLLKSNLGPFVTLTGLLVLAHMGFILLGMQSDEKRETGFQEIVAVLWFALALFSILPDGSWVLTFLVYCVIAYFWKVNRSDLLPFGLVMLYFSTYIGFYEGSGLEASEALGWAGLAVGLNAVAFVFIDMAGVLFNQESSDDEVMERRDGTLSLIRQFGTLGFFIGYGVASGIGPVLATGWLGYTIWRKGDQSSMLFFPPILTFAIINMLNEMEIGEESWRMNVGGVILAVQGLFYSFLASKDDVLYDWERFDWESDEVFFQFMDRLGIAGVLFTVIGIMLTFDSSLDSIAYLVMTLYLVLLGIQGFSEENDAMWRRGFGGYGSIFSAFMFSNTLDGLYALIGVVFTGMVALGFGFLFMQRMNEDGIYVGEEGQPTQQPMPPQPSPEPEEISAQEETVEEEVAAEAPEASEETEEEVETDEAPEEVLETTEETVEEDEFDWAEEGAKTPQPTATQSGLLQTDQGFSIRLPEGTITSILASVTATPHKGFVPVVGFSPSGQIILNFEPESQ